MLHQMTWPPQSPNLNQIEMFGMSRMAELRKSSQQVLSICGNSVKTVGKAFQVKLVEEMSRVCKAVNKAKGGYLEESLNKFLTGTVYYNIVFVSKNPCG